MELVELVEVVDGDAQAVRHVGVQRNDGVEEALATVATGEVRLDRLLGASWVCAQPEHTSPAVVIEGIVPVHPAQIESSLGSVAERAVGGDPDLPIRAAVDMILATVNAGWTSFAGLGSKLKATTVSSSASRRGSR